METVNPVLPSSIVCFGGSRNSLRLTGIKPGAMASNVLVTW